MPYVTLEDVVHRIDYWQHHPSLRHLGLQHYRFQVRWINDEHDGGDEYAGRVAAGVNVSEFYSDAWLKFDPDEMDSPEWGDDDRDRYIVHELLHVAARNLEEALDSDVEDYFPPPLVGSWKGRVRHAEEGFLDSLARVIVSLDNATQ